MSDSLHINTFNLPQDMHDAVHDINELYTLPPALFLIKSSCLHPSQPSTRLFKRFHIALCFRQLVPYVSISPALLSLAHLLLHILGLAVFDLHCRNIWSSFSWRQRKACLFFYVCAWFLDTEYDIYYHIICMAPIGCTLTKFCTQVVHHQVQKMQKKNFQMFHIHRPYLRTSTSGLIIT